MINQERKTIKDVGVSIVTHGTPPSELVKAVDCIIRCPRVHNIDIIDNSGSPLPDEYAKSLDDKNGLIKISRVKNRGYGAGHNISMKQSLSEGLRYHLVMNSDIWWEGDVLSHLCEVLDKREDVAHIMPKVYYPDGALQLTARRLPTPYDVFAKRFLPGSLTKRRIRKYLLQDADHNIEINSPYLLGSFMLLRTKALKSTGLFDERFFMYPEDIDLTRRLHRRYQTVYYPDVSIVHEHKAASRKSWKMLKIHVVNMIKYFNKWGWWLDSERRKMNRSLESNVKRLDKGKIPEARG